MVRTAAALWLFLALPGEKVAWVDGYDAALADARATGRAVLIHLTVPVRGAYSTPDEPQVMPGG